MSPPDRARPGPADPFSMTAFDDLGLAEPLLRGVAKAGFETPTPVQAEVIPAALDGADLLVAAATGSGKTVAYLLPILEGLLHRRPAGDGCRALILAPTRELARQIHAHFLDIAGYTRLTAEVITGGESRGHQVAALRRNPDLIMATPGRLLEHLDTGEAMLDTVEYLVLDEADRMLDMGFAPDVISILSECPVRRPGGCQSMLFSATLEQRGLADLAGRLLREPRQITVDSARDPHPNIDHQILLSDEPEHKRSQLLWLLEHEAADKTLVFVNTRERADQLGNWLGQHARRAAVLHGDLDQRERKRVLGLFHDGRIDVLVATDVAARGLDVPGVGRVINFDIPRIGDDYLHRSGRTGRAGERGVAVNLVSAQEWNRMEGIVRYLHLTPGRRAIDALKARFQGPSPKQKRPKSKPGAKTKAAKKTGAKTKDRLRERKNIGKRRKPTSGQRGTEAGFTPPKRRDS